VLQSVDTINKSSGEYHFQDQDPGLFPRPMRAKALPHTPNTSMQQPFEKTLATHIDLRPLPIYSLLCSADIERALLCFDTLYRRCRDQFQLTILDDGSLTPRDQERLIETFGKIKILSKEEREDLVAPQLRTKPNCLRFREEQIFSLKLLDGPLLGTGAFALCDGDIYFVREFAGIDRRAIPSDDLVFMHDWCSAYSLSFPRRFLGRPPLRIPEGLNAGILYVGPETYDLDFIEWFLGEDRFRGAGTSKELFLLEQTAWAALAGRVRSSYFNPEQVAFATKDSAFSFRLVALHFARQLRQLLDDPSFRATLEQLPEARGEEVAQLESQAATFDGLLSGTIKRLYRKLAGERAVAPWATLSTRS
jgi:hypothetical protein